MPLQLHLKTLWRSLPWLLSAALLLVTAPVNALSLGEVEVQSRLNQPLRAIIPLQASPEELSTLEVALGSRQAFERIGIAPVELLYNLQFEIVQEANSAHIRLSSTRRVREPILEFVLTLHWANGRMLRPVAIFLSP